MMEKLDGIMTCRLHRLLTESSRVTVVSHTHPDGDAVGSSTAMCAFLKALGKDARVILPTPVGEHISFISGDILPGIFSVDPNGCSERIAASDLLICLDFNALSRTDDMAQPLRASKAPKVLIDHHLAPAVEEFDLCFSRTEVSSASELLYQILLEMPEIQGDPSRLPALSRDALMAGMTTDTNNFANSVFPSTLVMASGLLAAGVDRDAILSALYNSFSEGRVRLFGHMLKEAMQITPSGVAVMFLTQEVLNHYGVDECDTEGLVNQPLAIDRVKMSILVKEQPDGTVRVSVRSKRGVSANMCARTFFHGGGHEQAAGGKILVPEDVPSAADAGEYAARSAEKFIGGDEQ